MNSSRAQVASKLQRALACLKQGQVASARATLAEILDGQPGCFEALNLLGIIAAQAKNPREAVSLFDRAIAVDPDNPGPFSNKGLALQEIEQWDLAIASFDRAIAIKPSHAAAHFNRANALRHLNRSQEALESYGRAIAIKADFAQAHFNQGVLLHDLRRFPEALTSYDLAIESQDGYTEALFNRGNVLRELGQLQAALESFDQAIATRANYAEAFLNRGEVLQELGRMDSALGSYDRAIEIKTDYAKAYYNRGNTFKILKQFDRALASYDKCIVIEPDNADAHFNRAITLLARGDFERGWAAHEWRWKSRNGPARHQIKRYAQPLWSGEEDLRGKTILLHWEQGLGDTIHFCRYANTVSDLGARVLLLVQRPLAGVLATLTGVSQLIAEGDPLPDFDYHCPLLNLPLALKTRIESIPSAAQYLRAEPALIAKWRAALGGKHLPRIGLAWTGNPNHADDRRRSIALADLLRYLPPGFQYVSLQRETREATITSFPGSLDFANTAALIDCMDLIVSVDTSIAHLGGALGRKTWVLLSSDADWRWLLDREDSPWYPSVRLYRQQILGDWRHALERVAHDMQHKLDR